MTEPELIEDFFGVYLLYSVNPKYKGRTYIGYTRDPNRRILQHNRGTWAGGACRTNNKGPWKMVMVVHGFPNNISALRFEWAWQNPSKTTRLQHLNLKRIPRKESEFQFKLRVLSEMLHVGPWCRLPLLIRWLKSEFREEFPIEKKPPDHMIICSGAVRSKNLQKNPPCLDNNNPNINCLLCSELITDPKTKLECINQSCELIAHIICLAEIFLEPGEYIPVKGSCPFCNTDMKWGDLIRKLNGCSQDVTNNHEEASDDDEIESSDDIILANAPDSPYVTDPPYAPNSPYAPDSPYDRVSLDASDSADDRISLGSDSPNATICHDSYDYADVLVSQNIAGSSSAPVTKIAPSTINSNTKIGYDNFDLLNCENDL